MVDALRNEFPHNETITHNCEVWFEDFQYYDDNGRRYLRDAGYAEPYTCTSIHYVGKRCPDCGSTAAAQE